METIQEYHLLKLDLFAKISLPIAGPSALPTIFRTTVIPSDTPLDCLGVDSITILNPPTCNKDNPVAIYGKVTSYQNSVEWNIKRLKNPTVLIIAPDSCWF